MITDPTFEELKAKYPNIFSYIKHLECESGWKDLIDELCSKMSNTVVAAQVKEKFGGLRFYVFSGMEEDFIAIDIAENKSFTICEVCGKVGELKRNGHGWVKTVCTEHGTALGFTH